MALAFNLFIELDIQWEIFLRYGIEMTEKLHTLAYFSRSVASERSGSSHVELGRILATAPTAPTPPTGSYVAMFLQVFKSISPKGREPFGRE